MKDYFWNKIPLEYYFMVIGLFFGLQLVFLNPPWQTNDEDRHFYNSWNYAHGYIKPIVQGNNVGNPMPVELFNQTKSFQGIRFNEKSKLSKESIEKLKRSTYSKKESFFYNNPNYSINPVGYLPFIVGIKVGELFRKNPITVHWWARAFGLIANLLIVFYAIRIIPVYKNVLMLLALMPMSLYQASSVSYDSLCNAATILMVAFIIKWLFQNEKVIIRELVLFFLALFIQVFSKSGYYFVPLLILMVPSAKFNFSFPKLKLIAIIIAVAMLPTLTWQKYINSFHFPAGQPFQIDFMFGPWQNLAFHLQNIPGMITDLLGNVLMQGKNWIIGVIGRFGYSYTPLPEVLVFVYVLILLFVACIDHDLDNKLTLKQRGISLLVVLASIGLLLAGFYLVITPIGASVMFGVQGRYFIPLLPVILFLLFGTIPLNLKKYLPLFTVLITVFFLYRTFGFIEETFYFTS